MIVSVLRNSYPGDAYDDDDDNNNNTTTATDDDTVRFCLDFALFAYTFAHSRANNIIVHVCGEVATRTYIYIHVCGRISLRRNALCN